MFGKYRNRFEETVKEAVVPKHSEVMSTAMSVDEEMVFDAIEQDPNAEEFY